MATSHRYGLDLAKPIKYMCDSHIENATTRAFDTAGIQPTVFINEMGKIKKLYPIYLDDPRLVSFPFYHELKEEIEELQAKRTFMGKPVSLECIFKSVSLNHPIL